MAEILKVAARIVELEAEKEARRRVQKLSQLLLKLTSQMIRQSHANWAKYGLKICYKLMTKHQEQQDPKRSL
jgi:hypothetical protein